MKHRQAYALSQVLQHNSKEDCWFIIHGRVLNVTKSLEEHPGGEELLLEYAGKDATKAFEAIGHSKQAHNLLSKFQVGFLQGHSVERIDDNSGEQLPKDKEMEAYVINDSPKPKHSILVEFLPLVVAGTYLYCRCLA